MVSSASKYLKKGINRTAAELPNIKEKDSHKIRRYFLLSKKFKEKSCNKNLKNTPNTPILSYIRECSHYVFLKFWNQRHLQQEFEHSVSDSEAESSH